MGVGMKEKNEEDNPSEEDEAQIPQPEQRRLNGEEEEGIELKKVTATKPRRDKYAPPIMVLGETKPLFKTSHLRYALLTFNCILAIFGLVILVFAIWIRVDPELHEYDTTLDVDSYYTVCNMFIAAALILILFAFFGCMGVVAESQWMLITYLIIFFIIFVIELAAVIIIWTAPYSSTIQNELEKEIKRQVIKADKEDSSRYFMDYIQQHLECCGSVGQQDYKTDVPRSCRNEVTGNVHVNGCATVMLNYLRSKAGIIGGIGIPILVFNILAKLVCYFLIYNIRNESRYKMRD